MSAKLKVLELARKLVTYNTINPPGNEMDAATFLAKILEQGGFKVRLESFGDKRLNLVARRGGQADKLPICFTGHIDTVPLGTQKWSFDPFAAEIHNGRIYGRGTCDMKGGISAAICASLGLGDQLDTSPGIVLVITGGEETGCEGAIDLASKREIIGNAGAIVVAEPTGNAPFVGHKGALWLKGCCRGKAAHGSMPHLGDNAIYKMCHAILKLEEFEFDVKRHEYLGVPTLNVGTIRGGQNLNSVPDEAQIEIDIRSLPGLDHAQLYDKIAEYLGASVALEKITDLPAIWTSPTDEWMQDVFDVTSKILGYSPTVKTAPYFTDGSVLASAYGNAPTVILGPGETEMAHKIDEYCKIEQIEQAVEIYTEIMRRWCNL